MAYYRPFSYTRPNEGLRQSWSSSSSISPGTSTPGQAPSFGPGAGAAGGPGWVNLEKYLGVAQEQGRDMAGKVVGDVSQRADSVLGDAQKLGGLQAADNQSAIDLGDPTKIAFGSMSERPEYGDLTLGAEKSDSAVKNLGDQTGRKALISKTFGLDSGDYSSGEGKYDSFLVGAAGGDLIKGAQDKYGGLGAKLGLMNDASVVDTGQAFNTAVDNQYFTGVEAHSDQLHRDAEAEIALRLKGAGPRNGPEKIRQQVYAKYGLPYP